MQCLKEKKILRSGMKISLYIYIYIYVLHVFKEDKTNEYSVGDTTPPVLLSKLFFEHAALFFLFFYVITVASNRMKF